MPELLCKWLEARGAYVERSRDAVGQDAEDPVVARYAIDKALVLVSWDRDFTQQRFMKQRYMGLKRIGYSCPEPMAVERTDEIFDFIRFCFIRAVETDFEIRIAPDKVQYRDKLKRG